MWALGENCYPGAVSGDTHQSPAHAARPPCRAPASRPIAQGEGWSISEFICGLGPQDQPFEELHEHVAISAVVEGSFQYRSDGGKALLYPGSFLLGNASACYECSHEHGSGDRCIAFHFAPWLFEEVAASAAGSHRFRFRASMLPAMRKLAPTLIEIETAARGANLAAPEELAVRVAETVLTTVSGRSETTAATAARDQRRLSHVLRYMEEHAEQRLDLTALAAMAFMSKYHFLRTFRRLVGVTPHQFLLGLRMRRAAIALRTTSKPVATVAFDAGFGDLSTFSGHFREVFGVSPGVFRKVR